MKFYLSALEDLSIECDVLVCVFYSLLNQFNANNFFATNLTQTQSNRTRPTANIHQGRLFINLSKVLDLLEHFLKNWCVHLKESKWRYSKSDPTKYLLVVART